LRVSSSKPRLLVLTSTFPRWQDDPEPAFVYELSRRLGTRFAVTVLAPRAPGAAQQDTMDGMQVIRFPYWIRRWENLATHGGGILSRLRSNRLNYLLVPLFMMGQLWALIRLLRRQPFDLIHAHWLIPQGGIAVLGRLLTRQPIPLVCTSHGGDLYALRSPLLQWLKRWVINRSQMITVVSSAMRAHLLAQGIAADKVQVISMGVDLQQRFLPDPTLPRHPDELLFIGRLVEKKGLWVLLEAFAQLATTHPTIRLQVVGAGPLQAALHHQAETLGISHRITFAGMVAQAQLPQYYQQATLFVAPFLIAASGDQEGLGLVMVEALGCGCPVIASDLPAVRDVIRDGESGRLVPPGDVQALVAAIGDLLDDPQQRHTLAARGQQHCREHFDWARVAERYAALLTTLKDERR